jgi:hypothetical protein
MNISIFWKQDTVHMFYKDEKSLSFKHRVGAKPVTMRTQINIEINDCINLRWKKRFAAKVNDQFRRNIPSQIRVGNYPVWHITACRNPQEFSNKIANLIINQRRIEKGYNSYETASPERIKGMHKG